MAKTTKTPAEVLKSLMEEYQLNPFSLSKAIKINPTTARLLVLGKANITVPIALRLSKFFGQAPNFWLDIQLANDLIKAGNDKKLTEILKGITKVQKPTAAAKAKPVAKKPKAAGKAAKTNTLAEKRKKAAKAPGARAPKGKIS